MKITKEYETTICDKCGVEANVIPCVVCGKELCGECCVVVRDKQKKWGIWSVQYRGYVMCREHLWELIRGMKRGKI